jgi:hypothetical protein
VVLLLNWENKREWRDRANPGVVRIGRGNKNQEET